VNFARALDVLGERDRAAPYFERSLEFPLDRRERCLHALWLATYHEQRGSADRALVFARMAVAADAGAPQAAALLQRLEHAAPGP
jgi:hypothetical protein